MIEAGLVTKTVEIAQAVRLELSFNEARYLASALMTIEDKGLSPLFEDEESEALEKLQEVLVATLTMWADQTDDNNHFIEEQEA